ncbi:GDSL-type esterase/lipase family protein [Nocardioides sp.]|uniref:GDSL-type esterase/lipase family protein n=1 Tax=Nocardioides sp. TaxID=35761 RepID=UPI00273680D7|nr:GDSL-type esterase/lipase family protein [Nocardioides sp.]MDP3891001.1 GDSL-type esterase/lipase family protein [Nocardioides sp.]
MRRLPTLLSPAPAVLLLTVALVVTIVGVRVPDSFATRPAEVLVVGDSITAQGADTLQRLHRDWDIDGVSGRRVSALPELLRERLARGAPPRVVVMALGTNSVPGWTAQDYRSALATLPPATRVVLVTTWRDPLLWPEEGPTHLRAAVQADYSRWLRTIAWERPHTCLVDWRTTASGRPQLLSDGVHLTRTGRQVWAQAISRAVADCD